MVTLSRLLVPSPDGNTSLLSLLVALLSTQLHQRQWSTEELEEDENLLLH